MATGRLPDPNTAPLTAKGDLYTYSTVPARLAAGSNGDTLVADSSTSTGLRYNPQNALANPVINGGMDIWQRGTSIAVGTAVSYTTDRWIGWRAGSVAGQTVSRQTISDSTNLPNIQYAARVQRDSGNTSTNYLSFSTAFETVNSIPFAGKTITFSFYARAGANFSPTSSILVTQLYTGTGTDQTWIGGLTGSVNNQQNNTLTTTWQRFVQVVTIPTNATQINLAFIANPTGTAGTNDWFEITGVQIDLGTYTVSSAPTFRRSGGTLAGELAACQRYYQQIINGNSQNIGAGWNYSSTYAMAILYAVNTMRTEPTISVTSGTNFYTFERNGGTDSVNGFFGAANANPNNTITLRNSTEISGTAGDAGLWFSNSASANISLSAEL